MNQYQNRTSTNSLLKSKQTKKTSSGPKKTKGLFSFSQTPLSSLSLGNIQPKLTIGQPNDKYEREADAVADRIMRMSEENTFSKKELIGGAAGIQRTCAACEHEDEKEELQMKRQPPAVQTKCKACEEEELQTKPQQMKSDGGGQEVATPALSARLSSARGGGAPLPAASNAFMSRAIGADFSRVRIHTGGEAEQMNRSLQARAFTHGSDIYFNRGEYNPGSPAGKRLLGHELTHVVQQGEGLSVSGIQRQQSTSPFSCPVVVASQLYSRGNNDQGECQYETARIKVDLILDTCLCSSSSLMPLAVNYEATLGGKSFTGRTIPNPSGPGTVREQEGQASAIASGVATPGRSGRAGRGMTLSESNLPAGTTNVSGPLNLTIDDSQTGGRPGDPGDTLTQQLALSGVNCSGQSKGGQVSVGGYQVINYTITADNSGASQASITLDEPTVPQGRVRTPLINLTTGGTAYPNFPGTPRGPNCTCDPVTGVHRGSRCSFVGGGASVGP